MQSRTQFRRATSTIKILISYGSERVRKGSTYLHGDDTLLWLKVIPVPPIAMKSRSYHRPGEHHIPGLSQVSTTKIQAARRGTLP